MVKLIFLAPLFFVSMAFGASDLKSEASKILKKYSNSVGVKLLTEKEENKKTLGVINTEDIEILYSQGKIRLTKKDPETIVIYNKKLWIVESPDLELDPSAKRKVTVIKNLRSDFVKQLTTMFSEPNKILKKASDISDQDGRINVSVNELNEGIKKLILSLDSEKKEIVKIIYQDDVDNEITLKVQKTEFLKKVSSDSFKYIKKKNDEVLNQ